MLMIFSDVETLDHRCADRPQLIHDDRVPLLPARREPGPCRSLNVSDLIGARQRPSPYRCIHRTGRYSWRERIVPERACARRWSEPRISADTGREVVTSADHGASSSMCPAQCGIAESRAVPGSAVALVAGAGWSVRYPAEALVASCRCARGACTLASSRAGAGLSPAPPGSGGCSFVNIPQV